MIKYQEALNHLYDNATNGEPIYVKEKYISAINQSRDDLQELIDLRKPKKPYVQFQDEICCPNCHEPIENNGQLVTECCYQRLDWSDDE